MSTSGVDKFAGIDADNNTQQLAEYVHSKLSSDGLKTVFADSFLMSLINKSIDFPVDGDAAQRWLGYELKHHFKRFFTSVLVEDIDYRIYTRDGEKGRPSENFQFTVRAFKRLGLRANTANGIMVQDYFLEMEELVLEFMKTQMAEQLRQSQMIATQAQKERDEAEERAHRAEEALEMAVSGLKLYAFALDVDIPDTHYKIGISKNTDVRQKPFMQTHPRGEMRFTLPVNVPLHLSKNQRQAPEQMLHLLLYIAGHHQGGETYAIELDTAKRWIYAMAMYVELASITDSDERLDKLVKLTDFGRDLLNGSVSNTANYFPTPSAVSGAITTYVPSEPGPSQPGPSQPGPSQPEVDHSDTEDKSALPNNKDKFKLSLDRFVDECCVVDPNAEVSSGDFRGQYRLWTRIIEKERDMYVVEYMKTRFMPIRLTIQESNKVVHGVRGVALKPQEPYRLPFVPTIYETFVYSECFRGPCARILMKDADIEFSKWARRNDHIITESHLEALHKYLTTNFLKALIHKPGHTSPTGGIGFYGVGLQSDKYNNCKAGSTGKKVYKVDILTDRTVNTWDTIAKAAIAEKVAPCKMSTYINKERVVNGFKYVTQERGVFSRS